MARGTEYNAGKTSHKRELVTFLPKIMYLAELADRRAGVLCASFKLRDAKAEKCSTAPELGGGRPATHERRPEFPKKSIQDPVLLVPASLLVAGPRKELRQ